MSPSLDSARTAASTLDWLNANGHAELVRNAIAVVNAVREEGPVEVDKIGEHKGRCRAVVQVPWILICPPAPRPRSTVCAPLPDARTWR